MTVPTVYNSRDRQDKSIIVTMEQNYWIKRQEMEMWFVNRKGLVTDIDFSLNIKV